MDNNFKQIIQMSIDDLTPEQKYFVTLHREIINSGNAAANSALELARKLKEMRDSKAYLSAGYEDFNGYVEDAVGIKSRQAYYYISVCEKFSEEYLQSNAQLGITKLALLAAAPSDVREDVMQETDIENITVRELREELKAKENRIQQLQMDYDSLSADVKDKQAAADDAAKKQIASLQKEVDKQKASAESLRRQLADAITKRDSMKRESIPATGSLEMEELKTSLERAEEDLERAEEDLKKKEAEIAAMQKSLEISKDNSLTTFRVKFEEWQTKGAELFEMATVMVGDNGTRCMRALRTVINDWAKRISE